MVEDTRTEEQKDEDRKNRLLRIKHFHECVGMPMELAEITEDLSVLAVHKAIESIDTVAATAPPEVQGVVRLVAMQMIVQNVRTAIHMMQADVILEGMRNGAVIILGDDTGDEAGGDTVH